MFMPPRAGRAADRRQSVRGEARRARPRRASAARSSTPAPNARRSRWGSSSSRPVSQARWCIQHSGTGRISSGREGCSAAPRRETREESGVPPEGQSARARYCLNSKEQSSSGRVSLLVVVSELEDRTGVSGCQPGSAVVAGSAPPANQRWSSASWTSSATCTRLWSSSFVSTCVTCALTVATLI